MPQSSTPTLEKDEKVDNTPQIKIYDETESPEKAKKTTDTKEKSPEDKGNPKTITITTEEASYSIHGSTSSDISEILEPINESGANQTQIFSYQFPPQNEQKSEIENTNEKHKPSTLFPPLSPILNSIKLPYKSRNQSFSGFSSKIADVSDDSFFSDKSQGPPQITSPPAAGNMLTRTFTGIPSSTNSIVPITAFSSGFHHLFILILFFQFFLMTNFQKISYKWNSCR